MEQRAARAGGRDGAPGSCTPFWRGRVSRRTAWTSASEGIEADDAPGTCTPFWRSRISRRTTWTSAPGGSRVPPPGVAPGSPAYETGASLPMLRRRAAAAAQRSCRVVKVRRGLAPRSQRLQLCASLHGSRTGLFVEFGRGRTRTPCPSGHHARSRRGRRLGRVLVHRCFGAAGLAPATSASQTRRPAPGPRPTCRARMSEDSHLTPAWGAHALAGRPGASSGSASTDSPSWTRTRIRPVNSRPLYFGANGDQIGVARIALAASASRTQRSPVLSYTPRS